VTPAYALPAAQEAAILAQLVEEVEQALGLRISGWAPMSGGQNPTYQLAVEGQPRYLLKVPLRRGYPSVANLQVCYNLLQQAGLRDYRIVYHSAGSEIVPYGFFVQPWLDGQALDPDAGNEGDPFWLVDFITVLRQVHTIQMPGFGYLAHGPQYASLQDYFDHMDEVVDHSFGQVLETGASIWDLDRQGVTSPGFLASSFAAVRALAQRIQCPAMPVLLHGDMLPGNLLYTAQGPMLLDWDESRAGWWVYEIARTLYYLPFDELLDFFLDRYGAGACSYEEIRTGIRLEHVRQTLRHMCISTFNVTEREVAQAKVRGYEEKISSLLAILS
jgi:aminoglycoside phosphotransferase (APT) family kinase protein